MVAKWPYAAADKDIEYYQLKQKYNHKADVLAQRVETLTDELAKEQALHQATAEALAFEREHRMDPVLMERLQHEQEDHAHTKTRLDQLELQTSALANENLTLRHEIERLRRQVWLHVVVSVTHGFMSDTHISIYRLPGKPPCCATRPTRLCVRKRNVIHC